MWLRRCAPALVAVAALLATAPACSDASRARHQTDVANARLAKAGLRLVLPRGWQGRIVRADRRFPDPAIEAANFPLPPLGASVEVPSRTGLNASQLRLVLLEVGNPPGRRFPPTRHIQPLSRADFMFRLPAVPTSHAFARRHFAYGGRSFSLMVEFGARPAPRALLRATNELLASLRIRPAPGSNPAYWRPLRRPLTFPRFLDDGCQPSPTTNSAPGVATALGRGPAYAVLGSAQGADLSGDLVSRGWYYHKTLWAVSRRYQGPLLVRGRRLDGPDGIRFHVGGPPLVELRVPPESGGRRWRYLVSDTLFRSAGCYGFQIDAPSFTEKIVFRVSSPPHSVASQIGPQAAARRYGPAPLGRGSPATDLTLPSGRAP